MLEDKRKDLTSEKQKALLRRLVSELSQKYGDLYYQPTAQIAVMIRQYAEKDAGLNADEHALLKPLSDRDLEVLLSLH
ncbi:MAG: hypothetical protein AAGF13_06420 [Pseudomonadota bacterium]